LCDVISDVVIYERYNVML